MRTDETVLLGVTVKNAGWDQVHRCSERSSPLACDFGYNVSGGGLIRSPGWLIFCASPFREGPSPFAQSAVESHILIVP